MCIAPQVMDMVPMEFHNSCDLAPREKRILDRNINVYYQRKARKADRKKTDERVKKYCKLTATPVRKDSILTTTASALSTLLHTKKSFSPKNPSFHLPTEINYQVLSHLTALDSQRSEDDPLYREYCSLCHLKTLYNCCLISKSWNGAATAILYSKLKLDLDGTCEYHWRGIPWGDGVFWWVRRTSYLSDRYLKLLLRALAAKPDLGKYFRTVEIDLHHHLPCDYKALPLYTKLISLCPNLTTIIGDPCIFFAPIDPYLSSLSLDILNFLSRGSLHKGRQFINLQHQKKLWGALSKHSSWESWEWTGQCQKIQLLAFHRFHQNWKSLKHLSIKDLHYNPGNSPTGITANPIACLDALESLSLYDTGLRILRNVPANKLTTLNVELLSSNNSLGITFQEDLTELWVYLSKCSDVTSRLQKLSIRSAGRYVYLTKMWLPKTLSLTPNLQELSISFPYTTNGNYIVLGDDQSLSVMGIWQGPFPRCAKLQKLSFLCPGWSHNKLLVKTLRKDKVFPLLKEIEYYDSTAIVELGHRPVDGKPAVEASCTSKMWGEKVDCALEMELVRKRKLMPFDSPENFVVCLKKASYKEC